MRTFVTTTPAPANPAGFGSAPVTERRLSGTKVFFITVLGVIVGLFAAIILLFLFFIGLASLFGGKAESTDPIVLELDLRQGVLDSPVQSTLFSDSPQSVVGIVRALERAAEDNQVKGVFIRGESLGLAPASAEELRLALLDFRAADKFVITHAQGVSSTSIIPYQVLAASDEIWLQASESVSTAGMFSQSEFLGGTMEKLGAQPQFFRHGDYKTAVNSYTETGYTDAHRESTTSLLTSLFDLAVDNISEDRDIPKQRLLSLLDTSPHQSDAALEAGLVDKLGYLEEAKDYALEKAGGGDAAFKSIASYAPSSNIGKPVIALVNGQGTIMPSQPGGGSPFSANVSMEGEAIARAFDAALENDDVQAIVFRVSSPGGSAAASDQMLAAVKRAQDAGKPVIVSMGQYAASGGYYVATSADHIVAMPQTITGSIGVFGGKIAFEDTFAKAGYNLESTRVGGVYAGAYNIDEPFTPEQAERYQGEMDAIYDEFVGLVADGRDMSRDDVIAIAEGRVWTGAQALERGLVDELGGLNTAIAAAKRLADIEEESDVRLRVYPRLKTREELFNDLLSGSVQSGRDLETLSTLLNSPEVQQLIEAREALTRQNRELEAPLPHIQ
jgi:protease-4